MSKARIIVSEITLTKSGQVKHFQIKLPDNVEKIVAIETDVFISTPFELPGTVSNPNDPAGTVGHEIRSDYLNWKQKHNPAAGKLTLQSLEKANIFFHDWVKLVELGGGVKDLTEGIYVVNPYSLLTKSSPKKVNVPIETTLINAMYRDYIGANLARDLNYKVKVFVWILTKENDKGLQFEFLKQEEE
jgi:hypothetical protein